MENPLEMEVLMGKSSINGSFSMAMLNNQMVRVVLGGVCPACLEEEDLSAGIFSLSFLGRLKKHKTYADAWTPKPVFIYLD